MRIFRNVLIIADDFIGANDTAVQFAKFLLTTVTLVTSSNITSTLLRELAIKYDVVAINTESRALESAKAYEIAFNVAERIREAFNGINNLLLYKKMRQYCRGN